MIGKPSLAEIDDKEEELLKGLLKGPVPSDLLQYSRIHLKGKMLRTMMSGKTNSRRADCCIALKKDGDCHYGLLQKILSYAQDGTEFDPSTTFLIFTPLRMTMNIWPAESSGLTVEHIKAFQVPS